MRFWYLTKATILTGRIPMLKFTQVYFVIEFGEIIQANITYVVGLPAFVGSWASSIL